MAQDRLAELRKTIDRADQAYYYNSSDREPFLADEQYDNLKKELRLLAPGDKRFARVGAPVPKDSLLKKVKNSGFMGSLQKIDTPEELAKWHANSGGGSVLVSLKADGASLALYYEKGELTQAITRGGDDGVGEDVTANAIHFIGVPTTLPVRANIMVRGECVLTIDKWKQIDPEEKTNPRNLGNGRMRRLDGLDSEKLTFLAFDAEPLKTTFPDEVVTESDKIDMLVSLGFKTITSTEVQNIELAIGLFNKIAADRPGFGYWIDGVVFKIDNLQQQKALGIVDNRPRGQMVMKFEAEGEVTTLERVELTVGHTGAIIPTGKVSPVRIGGTTVSSVLLNNFDMIEALDLAIGDEVRVIKAKDIIPQVVAVVSRPPDRQPIKTPEVCPACGGPAGRRVNIAKGAKAGEDGAVIECKSPTCSAKGTARLDTWIKKLDIQGIGDEVLAGLVETHKVLAPSDLYAFANDPVRMAFLPALKVGAGKLGINRAKAIIENIRAKQQMPVNLFIGSLGIPHLGRRRAELIMEACPGVFESIDDWLDADKLRANANAAGIKNMVTAIVAGIDAMRDEIAALRPFVTIVRPFEEKEKEPSSGVLTGRTFCFTGKIEKTDEGGKRYTRDRMQQLVIENGGAVSDDVRAGVTDLVQADVDSVSSKSTKAKKLGVNLLSEADFFVLLGL